MSTARPRILITIGRDLPDRGDQLRLPISYVEAVLSQGAVPTLVPPGLDPATIAQLVDEMDGLLLPGGVDPHPRHFHEEVHPMTVIDEDLDELELATVAAARDAHLPILGICRGSQVLNVALGGSLIQHLDTTIIDHKPDGPLGRHVHRARLEEGTRLRGLSEAAELHVNSWHHQAIDRLGTGLRVAAVAEDGVVEAIESIDADEWILGVQYHPEELMGVRSHRALLTEFVRQARVGRLSAPSLTHAAQPAVADALVTGHQR